MHGSSPVREGAPTREANYLPTLAGWRAVSVIAVVLYHGRNQFFGDDSLLTRFSARGHLGVDVFFSISGFLICRMLVEEYARAGDIDLRRFYVRRAFRILPPYYVALAAFSLLEFFGVIQNHLLNLPSCLLFYRNFMPLGMDDHGDFYTAHFWSLAVEEQFYLLWPLLLLALRAARAARVALGLAVMSLGWKMLEGHFQVLAGIMPAGMSLLASTDTLLWGCLAAIYFPEIRRRVAFVRCSQLWLPVMIILVVTQGTHSPVLLALSAVLLPALMLSTVLQPASWLGRALEWRPLCWIGALSYSIYLWQELFLPELLSEGAHGTLRFLQRPPWNLVAILLCACCSRYLIEIPAIRWGHRLSANPLVLDKNSSSHRTGAWKRYGRFSVGRAPGQAIVDKPDVPRWTGS